MGRRYGRPDQPSGASVSEADAIDKLDPERRALVYEYGWPVYRSIAAFLEGGVAGAAPRKVSVTELLNALEADRRLLQEKFFRGEYADPSDDGGRDER